MFDAFLLHSSGLLATGAIFKCFFQVFSSDSLKIRGLQYFCWFDLLLRFPSWRHRRNPKVFSPSSKRPKAVLQDLLYSFLPEIFFLAPPAQSSVVFDSTFEFLRMNSQEKQLLSVSAKKMWRKVFQKTAPAGSIERLDNLRFGWREPCSARVVTAK